jgi:hypothetical protein
LYLQEVTVTEQEPPISFTETHHALLFGWMAQALLAQAGEQAGEAVIRKAVRQYGNERGRRMALRAKANRHALTMANFIAYGEWKPSPGLGHKMQKVEKTPAFKVHIHQCPWHQAWKDRGLVAVGRLYCLEVDKALVHGFNPDLVLGVNGTLPDGAEHCEFVYHDANLTPINYLKLAYHKYIKPGKSAAMPWEYHLGHLYTTFERVAVEALGEAGRSAVQTGLDEFTRQFGQAAAQRVAAYRTVDFERVPPSEVG